jgi:hypothetical protein
VIWVNRSQDAARPGRRRSRRRGQDAARRDEAARRSESPPRGRRASTRRLVATSAVWADDLHAGARRRRGFVVDSPVLPTSWRRCRRCCSRRVLVERAAGDARRLGPPARAPGLPGRGARRRETTAARLTGAPGEAAARAARLRRASTTSSGRAAALGQRAGAAGPRARRHRLRELELHPPTGTPSTGWRLDAVGAGADRGDYLSPVEIPMVVDRARAPIARRSSACARSSSGGLGRARARRRARRDAGACDPA